MRGCGGWWQKTSCQAKRAHFRDVAAKVMCHQVSIWTDTEAQWNQRLASGEDALPAELAIERASVDTHADPESDDGADPPRRKARRTGGGGEWRLHVGRCWRAGERDLGRIRSTYLDRCPDQRAADREEGQEGTVAHRHRMPAFGPRARDLEQQRVLAAARAMRTEHVMLTSESFVQNPQFAITPVLRDLTQAGYTFACKAVRAADRLDAEHEKQMQDKENCLVVAYAASTGADQAAALVRAIPSLAQLGVESFHGLPFVSHTPAQFNHVSWAPSVRETSRLVYAMLKANPELRPTGLYRQLDEVWGDNCSAVLEEDWSGPNLTDQKEPADPHAKCREAGICFQTKDGRNLYKCRNRILAAMKRLAPPKSDLRRKQVEGRLALKIRGSPREQFFEPDPLGWDEYMGASDAVDLDVFYVWHLSFLLLSPYVPCWQLMQIADCEETGLALGAQEVEVQVLRESQYNHPQS